MTAQLAQAMALVAATLGGPLLAAGLSLLVFRRLKGTEQSSVVSRKPVPDPELIALRQSIEQSTSSLEELQRRADMSVSNSQGQTLEALLVAAQHALRRPPPQSSNIAVMQLESVIAELMRQESLSSAHLQHLIKKLRQIAVGQRNDASKP